MELTAFSAALFLVFETFSQRVENFRYIRHIQFFTINAAFESSSAFCNKHINHQPWAHEYVSLWAANTFFSTKFPFFEQKICFWRKNFRFQAKIEPLMQKQFSFSNTHAIFRKKNLIFQDYTFKTIIFKAKDSLPQVQQFFSKQKSTFLELTPQYSIQKITSYNKNSCLYPFSLL